MLSVLLLLGVILSTIIFYVNLHPTFGGKVNSNEKETYERCKNCSNGKFTNQVATTMNMSLSTILSLMKDSMVGRKERKPKSPILLESIAWDKIQSERDSMTWFGHSTFLLSIDNKILLLDPMFGPTPSPVSFAGGKRYSEDLLYVIDKLPSVDAVFITHDHYDHLDYPSIIRLRDKVGHFFVPYGVGAHLLRWGVKKEKISELTWWDEVQWKGLKIASVPSQHFSGRGLFNRDTTLWSGWVIFGKDTRLYTSGDGGYGPHFKQIGEKYGPFDITLIEGGQYDPRWSGIHMQPEESVQANLDVRGDTMMLIHWGAFTLAYHSWTEPVERALKEAREKEVHLITPKIGETVMLEENLNVTTSEWWKE